MEENFGNTSSEMEAVEEENFSRNSSNNDSSSDMDMVEEEGGNEEDDVAEKENGRERETPSKKVEDPKIGMSFDSIEILKEFYKDYGTQVCFTVSKRTSSKGYNEVTRYVTIACGRSGKSKRTSKNILRPKAVSKTNSQAKVNVVLY